MTRVFFEPDSEGVAYYVDDEVTLVYFDGEKVHREKSTYSLEDILNFVEMGEMQEHID